MLDHSHNVLWMKFFTLLRANFSTFSWVELFNKSVPTEVLNILKYFLTFSSRIVFCSLFESSLLSLICYTLRWKVFSPHAYQTDPSMENTRISFPDCSGFSCYILAGLFLCLILSHWATEYRCANISLFNYCTVIVTLGMS